MAVLADLTVKVRWADEGAFLNYLEAVRELAECARADLDRMDVGPRTRIAARLNRLKEVTPAFAESVGVEVKQ